MLSAKVAISKIIKAAGFFMCTGWPDRFITTMTGVVVEVSVTASEHLRYFDLIDTYRAIQTSQVLNNRVGLILRKLKSPSRRVFLQRLRKERTISRI
jgi:hypothetical protein